MTTNGRIRSTVISLTAWRVATAAPTPYSEPTRLMPLIPPGAAPGGISGMSLVGSEYGVGAAVATLHAVRLITVLLILPLIVKCLNLFGVIKS